MIAILKREWKSYFQNITGWLFIAAVLALYGLYFFAYNLRSGYPYISYSLSAISFIMLLAVPVLTMRSLAEERHSKTDQLVLTAPISPGKMILGKYLAMVSVYTAAMLVIAVTPCVLSIYGTVPMGESYVAIFGFWLYGCACIAIGMLLSSLTESQVIAAVATFGALFLGYMMRGILSLISETGNMLTVIFGAYDLYTPMESFLNGCLDVAGMVYFLSVILLCLFLSCQSIQKRRYSMSVKKLKTGVFSVGMIVAGFAAAIGVNLFVQEMPSSWTAIDATSTRLYSLTEDTKAYLEELSEDVTIYVLASEKNADTTLAETLKRYEDLSGHIQVEYKNPSVNPAFYQQYTDTAPSSNSLIVESSKRSRVIDYSNIYEYSYDYTTYSSSLVGYDAEGQLTSAIQYVTLDGSEMPVIYEVTGHGETALSGGFTEAVEKANVTLTELTLLTEDTVPEDAAAIIVNAPTSDFSKEDADKVISYLNNGGKAIITCNFQYQELANFASVFVEYGIERVSGIVMENNASYFYGNVPYYLLPEVDSSEYTSSVSGKYVFAPYSEGFTYPGESEDTAYIPLLLTTEEAVSKADAANAVTSEYEEGDTAGPFVTGIAVERTIGEETMQLVLLGSPQIFSDEADQVVSGNNVAMFTDILTCIVDSDALAASVIPVKEYSLSTITVTSAATLIGGMLASIVVPLALLAAGIVIWAVRRKK